MNRAQGWRIIEWAARLGKKGNEQGASDLLFQAARYFSAVGDTGKPQMNVSLADFARKIGIESCFSCGLHKSEIETHLEGCPELRANRNETDAKDFGLPGEAG